MSAALPRADWPRLEQRIVERLGMRCDESLRARLAEVVDRRMRRLGTGSYAAYLERLARADSAELNALAQDLTIGESYFFRGHDHFQAFTERVLPERLRAQAATRRLRFLSAGCASGEEPYSLAILLREHVPDIESWDIDILGVDINAGFLDKARQGIYTPWSFRDAPPHLVQRYFRSEYKQLVLDPAVRAMVRFREQNLMEDGSCWHEGPYDAIFCRNVLIYFTGEAIAAVLARAEQALAPQGYLFLGHAESLRGLTRAFHLCQTHETFYYRLRGAHESPPPESLPWSLPTPEASEDIPATSDDLVANHSWVDAIQRSAARIAELSENRPASSGPERPTSNRELLERALALFRLERYAEVEALIARSDERALDTDTLLLLAAALTHHGRVADAEAVCARIQARDELNAEAAYLLAVCHEHDGALPAAMREAQSAAYLDPQFAMPHLLLGRLARRRGDISGARRALGQALDRVQREDATRILLFGGGFSREALAQLCRSQLAACGGRR